MTVTLKRVVAVLTVVAAITGLSPQVGLAQTPRVNVITPQNGDSIFAGTGAGQMTVAATIETPPASVTVTGVQVFLRISVPPLTQIYANTANGNQAALFPMNLYSLNFNPPHVNAGHQVKVTVFVQLLGTGTLNCKPVNGVIPGYQNSTTKITLSGGPPPLGQCPPADPCCCSCIPAVPCCCCALEPEGESATEGKDQPIDDEKQECDLQKEPGLPGDEAEPSPERREVETEGRTIDKNEKTAGGCRTA